MPHLILEVSNNLAPLLQAENILARAHAAMQVSGLFVSDDIRSRAYVAQDYAVGNQGGVGSFAHALIYLMPGRDVAQKRALTQAVVEVLKAGFPDADFLSVDLRELEPEIYQKHKRNMKA